MKWFYKCAYWNTRTRRWIKKYNRKDLCIGIDKKQLEERKGDVCQWGWRFSEVCGELFVWRINPDAGVIYVSISGDPRAKTIAIEM